MTISIRNATDKDIPRLEELEKQSFSVPWTAQMLINQLHGDGRVFLAADVDGELAGYIGMWYVLDEGYITNVAVAREHQSAGVATALIRELIRRSYTLSLLFLSLEVRESNMDARRLYSGLEFKDVGKRPGYYEHPDEDAVIMTLFLK